LAGDPVARPEAKPLRLFVAVDVPEDVKRAVAVAVEPWRTAYPEARWVPAENWHVTLKFLGNTMPQLVAWVEETVAAVASSHVPVTARIGGLGAFPTPRRGRILWAGIDDPTNALGSITAGLEAALAAEFPAETRPFHPHLTVARSQPPLHLPEPFVATPLLSEPFAIDRLVLYRSRLQRPAPRYEPIGRFPLKT
jgi:2'-5' RNA ligase